MSSITSPFASPVEWKANPPAHSAILQASLLAASGAEWTPEAQWEAPTVAEWQRAVRIIALQFIRHISGFGYDPSIDSRLTYAHDKLLPRLRGERSQRPH
jgi:hypothetical protein